MVGESAESGIGVALMMKGSKKKREDGSTRPTTAVRKVTPHQIDKEGSTRDQHDTDPEEEKKQGG